MPDPSYSPSPTYVVLKASAFGTDDGNSGLGDTAIDAHGKALLSDVPTQKRPSPIEEPQSRKRSLCGESDGDPCDRQLEKSFPNKKGRVKKGAEKTWLCPYFFTSSKPFKSCLPRTSFRSFSDLRQHLDRKHRRPADGNSPRCFQPGSDLIMSETQWIMICNEPKMLKQTKPKNNSDAFLRKNLGRFRRIWHVLFPESKCLLSSPFCEDVSSSQVRDMLLEDIVDAEARAALGRGEISAMSEFRASRDVCGEIIQRALSIGALLSAGTRERTPTAEMLPPSMSTAVCTPTDSLDSMSTTSGRATTPMSTADSWNFETIESPQTTDALQPFLGYDSASSTSDSVLHFSQGFIRRPEETLTAGSAMTPPSAPGRAQPYQSPGLAGWAVVTNQNFSRSRTPIAEWISSTCAQMQDPIMATECVTDGSFDEVPMPMDNWMEDSRDARRLSKQDTYSTWDESQYALDAFLTNPFEYKEEGHAKNTFEDISHMLK